MMARDNRQAIREMLDAMRAAGFDDKHQAEAWAMAPNRHIDWLRPAEALEAGQYALVTLAARKYREERMRPRYVTLNADA